MNGYCESFNGKLRDEYLNDEIFYSLREAQVVIENWRIHYNSRRPHSALGYRPRLVEHDEAGTLATLKVRRNEVLVPTVAHHNGRVVKVMGDGVLVEFSSAVHAV